MSEPRQGRLRLGDGRRLGWLEVGDPAGFPVVHAHGGLSSRVEVAFAEDVARAAGVRLLAFDRPGVGLSEPCPGRSLLAWATDVARVLPTFGVERFAALGWSSGGPFALALAAGTPHLVTRVALVGSVAPFAPDPEDAAATLARLTDLSRESPGAAATSGAVPSALDGAPSGRRDRGSPPTGPLGPIDPAALGLRFDRTLFSVAPRSPRTAAALVRIAGALPAAILEANLRREAGPVDAALVATLEPGTVTSWVREALRAGPQGTVEDYQLLSRRWGFSLGSIRTAVDVWHGADDRICPPAHARRLAFELPDTALRLVPATGHFLVRTHLREILAEALRPRSGP